jgi:hypothetical protein
VQDDHANELQRRMALVREDLERNAARLWQNAQTLADWRYYVRQYPWLTLAAASAIGFLLVPKRASPIAASAEALAKVAREQGLVLQPTAKAAASSGILGGMINSLAKTLLRTSIVYAGQQVGQILASRMAAKAQAASSPDGAACGSAHEFSNPSI